ncbi:MAG: glycosyltransferase family 39 protein, partial [Planctomycetes bacterium]|nr:glycosyltransferase family 39 protein [Planctomycetota bacterium]
MKQPTAWFIGTVVFFIFLVRLAAPADLADNYHQERQAAYVLDILRNGHWICQRDPYGEIASKPPLHAWVSALASLALGGRLTWFTLVLPGALAATGTALLLFHSGRKYFGGLTGLFAALFFLLSSVGIRQIVQGRIDGLFAFTIAATALAAFQAWRSGRGWIWVWSLAVVATLTKGPLGVVLAGSGLVAAWWERRSGVAQPIRGALWPGVLVWLVISVGWVALAYWQWGQPMIDKVLGKELVGHVVTGRGGTRFPLQEGYMPPVNFLSRFAPWSLLTLLALWRVWKRPASDDIPRAFERFLFCWLLIGLAIFSFAAHQRPDLIYPLVPPAALLAGAELNRRLPAVRMRLAVRASYVVAIVGIVFVALQYHWLRR